MIPITKHYDAKSRIDKAPWMRIRLPVKESFGSMKKILRSHGLVTVCEEAHCPNIGECWQDEGTATFMVLGDTCTRGCKFCAVKTGKVGEEVDVDEPSKIASACKEMKLGYAAITSVDRDDLLDQGSEHFAEVIKEVKSKRKETLVEVLIPDFQGKEELIRNIVDARPDVIAHNVETVKRLQKIIRDPRAGYEQSLGVLSSVKKMDAKMVTKSSIMLGLGETKEEVIQTMKDLLSVGVDILTLGQYLQPKSKILTVKEYVTPTVFEEYKRIGEKMGFKFVASDPLVRSSYRAGELFVKNIIVKQE